MIWSIALSALVIVTAIPSMAAASGCGIRLQMAYKKMDDTDGHDQCAQAAAHLSSLGGPVFACEEVTSTESVAGVPVPTFGGIHAFNDFYGTLIVSTTADVTTAQVKDFYHSLHEEGGLKAMSSAVSYPREWLNSCCSDPPMVLTDTCKVNNVVYGEWAIGCSPCE